MLITLLLSSVRSLSGMLRNVGVFSIHGFLGITGHEFGELFAH
jgi:hypothetical protein